MLQSNSESTAVDFQMENVAEQASKTAGRRRKSAADVHSSLNHSKLQSGTPLHSITEDGPVLRTPLSATPDANVQPPKNAELQKKTRRRSSTAGVNLDVAERRANPQTRSFMEVKRSEEAHILKAQRLESMLGLVQAELSHVKDEALRATAEVFALKTTLSESERERELLSSRYADSASELAAERGELEQIRQKLQDAVEECAGAKSEAAEARDASERHKALTEVFQRRGVQLGLDEELEDIQKKVHEQDEFACNLRDLHEQVERTRQDIKERTKRAAERASTLGLRKAVEGPLDSKGASSPLTKSTSAGDEGALIVEAVAIKGDVGNNTISGNPLDKQLLDWSALSRLTASLQTEASSEDSQEAVSLNTIPEAAEAPVADESETQLDNLVENAAGTPALLPSDEEPACTEGLIKLSKAEGVERTPKQLDPSLEEPATNSED